MTVIRNRYQFRRMMETRPKHFAKVKGSPLAGKRIPRGWGDTRPRQRRALLVRAGLAPDYSTACSWLSRHGAAVRAARKAQAEAASRT